MDISQVQGTTIDTSGQSLLRNWRLWVGIVAVYLVGLLIFSMLLGGYFVSDDFVCIKHVWAHGPWLTNADGLIPAVRPLLGLTLWTDSRIWGQNPLGYYLTNIHLHCLNSLLVGLCAWLLGRLTKTATIQGVIVAITAALFYLALPSHAEVVAWISCRGDLVATALALGSFAAFLAYLITDRCGWLLSSGVLFFAALFGKESVVSLPGVLALCHFTFVSQGTGRGRLSRLARAILPYVISLVLYFAIRYLLLGTIKGGYGAVHDHWKLIDLRTNLLSFYARALTPPLSRKQFLPVASIVAAWVGFRYRTGVFNQLKPVGFGIGAFFICVLPVLNLGNPHLDTVGQSERLIYLASVFSCIAAAFLLNYLIPARRGAVIVGIAITVIYVFQLQKSLSNWRTASELCRSIVVSARQLSPGHRMLVLDIPDSFNNAYVFRMGLGEALQLFSGKKASDVVMVTRTTLYEAADSVQCVPTEDGFDLRLVSRLGSQREGNVHCLNPDTADYVLQDWKANSCRIQLRRVEPDDQYVSYRHFGLVELRR